MSTIEGTIAIEDINIVTEMSVSAKARVYLASVKGTKQFVVYKELKDKGNLLLYKRLQDMQQEKETCFPRVYGVWKENEKILLIEEYISGETLEERIQKGFRFSEDELTDYMIQLCSALGRLHKAIPPIIHRDLKPDNIIITGNGELRLLDFDAAREYDKTLSRDTVILGTKEYAPPEQYGFAQTDVRSDIYSFGKVFDELLGNTDASGIYMQSCRKIIDKATMFDPDNRYADTGIMLKELQALRRPMTDKRKVLIPILAVILVMFGVIFGFVISSGWQNGRAEDAHLRSNIETTTQETRGDVSVSSEQKEKILRFRLSYGGGLTEYYESYDEVYNRICELNNPKYEYIITFIDNTVVESIATYMIEALPPVAGKLIFSVGDNINLKKCIFKMYNLTASYPIVNYAFIEMADCSFDTLIVDGSIQGRIGLIGENAFGNVILRNGAYITIAWNGVNTISRLDVKDSQSSLKFAEGACYIKELAGYKEHIEVDVIKGYDDYERQLIITDTDITLEQFSVEYSTEEQFASVLKENKNGQRVLALVKKGALGATEQQLQEGKGVSLSYGDVIAEYYESYEEVYDRICELNNSENEYVITYIDNMGYKESGAYNIKIEALPPVAGKLIFTIGDLVDIKKYKIQMEKVTATYPIVTTAIIEMTDCSFDSLTVNGRFGGLISLKGDNILENVILRNGAFLLVKQNGVATISRLAMEDSKSFLCFSAGLYYIKELITYNGSMGVSINRGFGYERQLIITDMVFAPEQFRLENATNISENYTLAIEKNENGQNVLLLVLRD